MTKIDNARFNELIRLQINTIRETVHKLNENCDLEELEVIITELEGTLTDMKVKWLGLVKQTE